MKHTVACMKHAFNFIKYSELFDTDVIDYLKIYFGLCSLFRLLIPLRFGNLFNFHLQVSRTQKILLLWDFG
jgi:hypothetical protein